MSSRLARMRTRPLPVLAGYYAVLIALLYLELSAPAPARRPAVT